MSAETDERSAFFNERCDDYLALFAVGKDLAGLRVNNLGIEEIIKNMHTRLTGAVDTDTRAVNLGKAVNIIEFDAELSRYIIPLGVAPALRADNAFSELDFIKTADDIKSIFKSRLNVTPNVAVVSLNTLPRSEKKTQRVFDHRGD